MNEEAGYSNKTNKWKRLVALIVLVEIVDNAQRG